MNELNNKIKDVLTDYRQALSQQMGLILSDRHRLDIKTADKFLIDTPIQAIEALITEQVRLGRIEENMKWIASYRASIVLNSENTTKTSIATAIVEDLEDRIKELEENK